MNIPNLSYSDHPLTTYHSHPQPEHQCQPPSPPYPSVPLPAQPRDLQLLQPLCRLCLSRLRVRLIHGHRPLRALLLLLSPRLHDLLRLQPIHTHQSLPVLRISLQSARSPSRQHFNFLFRHT